MTKIAIEDQELSGQIREYLAANGTEVAEDVAIHVSLPGAAKAPQKCNCGCGAMTSGGRFLPGHDAKLKSALFMIVRGTPEKVDEVLKAAGPMGTPLDEWTPEAAQEVLDKNDWGKPAEKKPPKKKEKAEGDEESADGEEKPKRTRPRSKKDEANAEGEKAVETV